MERDGLNRSLWQDVQSFIPKPLSAFESHYDVVIVGGGMTGIVTAFTLQNAGRKCLVVERHNLGFGTTGGTTAHLNTLLDTPYTIISKNFGESASRTVAGAAGTAIKTIEANIARFDIDCAFSETQAYLFSQTEKESEDLEEIVTASVSAGLRAELTTELPLPTTFQKAARFEDQAKFHPMKYLFAMAKALEDLGGQIKEGCQVASIEENDGQVRVHSSLGEITANTVVFATHIPPGINILHLRCSPWRSYAMAVKLHDEDAYPEGLIYDMQDPYHYYRTQKIDNKPYLIVGGKDHKTGENCDTEQVFLKLRAHIQKDFNIREVTHQWSSQYFEPVDGLPYIGNLPGTEKNIYVATGFGGNGMIYSHVAAMELTHQIMSGKSLFENLFSPGRIKPVAGFKNFIGHNADVVKHFVGKWFTTEHLTSMSELSNGEGKVVKFEDHMVAMSRDDRGNPHAISPVCTHMGCHVVWNRTEHTWDCPCHGARYSQDGIVLTGPATRHLDILELEELAARPSP
jgi:glycine/D-amino acid oxidase-like deaminating enzyme/nitrite reductase/ring-hydroxylating ferredoxin subunit